MAIVVAIARPSIGQQTFGVPAQGSYIFVNTTAADNPPTSLPDVAVPPLIINLKALGAVPGNVITLAAGGTISYSCYPNIPSSSTNCNFVAPTLCALFSSSNTVLPPSAGVSRVPGAISPISSQVTPCMTFPTLFGGFPTDIPQDFVVTGSPITVPPGAVFLIVAVADVFYADNMGSPTVTLSLPPLLTIIQPSDGSVIPYGNTFVATDPITFQADPGPANTSVVVSWTTTLEYATSAGTGAYSSDQAFSTTGNGTTPVTYNSTGGQVTVNAAANIEGQVISAKPVTIFVTGIVIPDSTITPELLSLYSGPTPRLLVGIADKESSYAQFRTLTLYGHNALWPNESAQDGGSHIGLMQMPTVGAARIWNWTQNATDGANWLAVTKLGIARSLVAQIRAAHPTLPDLTAAQYEQYALELYGDHPGKYWSQQYWVPVQSDPGNPNSDWVWKLGTANPLGSAYVRDVLSRINSH